jgi:hypothetical protein
VILETLVGVRTTQEAAEALGVSPPRYYQLETYALQGLVEALEPRPRGRQVSVELENERLRGEITRLEREVKRQQALYRTAQRALGVPAAPVSSNGKANGKTKGKSKGKKSRRRRRTTRGERVLRSLSEAVAEDTGRTGSADTGTTPTAADTGGGHA